MERQKVGQDEVNEMEILYDADPDSDNNNCNGGRTCPDIAYYPKSNTIQLISKDHDIVGISINTYNEFVRMVKAGVIKMFGSNLKRGEKCAVGSLVFSVVAGTDTVLVTGENGLHADISIKHFNKFVEAVKAGELKEFEPKRQK